MNNIQFSRTIKKFHRIKYIIEISKYDTLRQLKKVSHFSQQSFKFSSVAATLLNDLNNKFNLHSLFVLQKNESKKTLWVFVTHSSVFLDNTYSKEKKTLKKSYKRDVDQVIAIGKIAIDFAHKNNFKILYENEDFNSYKSVSDIITESHNSRIINTVIFLTNDNENKLQVIPISNVMDDETAKLISKKTKFYPSAYDISLNLLRTYIDRLTFSFFERINFHYLQNKLIKHNDSLNSMDLKLHNLQLSFNKLKRKAETNSQILISQNTKRMRKKGGV